jgi:hypothetical protein
MNDALTLGGFIALTTLVVLLGGVVARTSGRLATLEAKLAAHLENGARHE